MYLSRLSNVLALNQLGHTEEDMDGGSVARPRGLVSQCAYRKLTKISVKSDWGTSPPRVRSFGELSDIENM